MDTNPDQGVADLMAALDDAPVEQLPQEDAAPAVTEQDEAAPVQAATEEVAQDQPPEADDEEEVEFDGKTFKGPKGIKDALLRQQDYTRKTQEVAEQRKQVEAQAQAIAQQQQLLSVGFEKAADLKLVQARLAEFSRIDWRGLAEKDPAQATSLMAAYQATRDEAAQKQQEFQQLNAQHQQLIASQRQQMLEKGRTELVSRIPDFSPALAKRITESTQAYGYTAAELDQITDPRLVHILHDAMQFRALKAQQPKAARTLAEAPKVIKPSAPQPVRQNQAALDRLKKTGRAENLIDFL